MSQTSAVLLQTPAVISVIDTFIPRDRLSVVLAQNDAAHLPRGLPDLLKIFADILVLEAGYYRGEMDVIS